MFMQLSKNLPRYTDTVKSTAAILVLTRDSSHIHTFKLGYTDLFVFDLSADTVAIIFEDISTKSISMMKPVLLS
jgi:hypothetical protein